jgi:AcrR family transcriptional regulator
MARKTHKSSEEARNKILDAAEKIVVQVGPAGLRISAVAKQAHMAHPNIIHHFGSRQGLLNALAERAGQRSTTRITQAISEAMEADSEQRLAALTKVLDTVFSSDEGKLSIWLHLSGAEGPIKEQMQNVVTLSHQLRKSISPDVDFKNTNRLVLLITLALIGEAISGNVIKDALEEQDEDSHSFRSWLAALVLSISDNELKKLT